MRNLVLAAIPYFALALLAQDPAPSPAPPPPANAASGSEPVLRAETHLVPVNVVAKDQNGKAIADLKKENFTIKDEGTKRDIAFFSLEQVSAAPVVARKLPPGGVSNRAAPPIHAATIILFDGLNTNMQDQAYARQQLVKFLKTLTPGDSVALYTLGNNLHILYDFTSDTSKLIAAAGRSSVRLNTEVEDSSPTPANTGNDSVDATLDTLSRHYADYVNVNRIETTLKALNVIAERVAALPGRKNLVWISGGFPIVIGYDGAVSDPSRRQEIFSDALDQAARNLNSANLAVYPIDARGLIVDPGMSAGHSSINPISTPKPQSSGYVLQEIAWVTNPHPQQHSGGGGAGGVHSGGTPRSSTPRGSSTPVQTAPRQNPFPRKHVSGFDDNYQTMALLAEKTGGRAFHNRNDLGAAIGEAIDDQRVSYSLAFYVPQDALDNKFHKIVVSVDRPGVTLRYRQQYDATSNAAAPVVTLNDVIREPSIATGVGMTVWVRPGKGGTQDAIVNLDPVDLALTHDGDRWKGRIEMLALSRPAGTADFVYQGGLANLAVNLPEVQYTQAQTNGLNLIRHVTLPPGKNELRIAVRDLASGAVGSIYVSTTVGEPQAKGPMK